jgi:hypothetical protein
MVVILTWTFFRSAISLMEAEERFSAEIKDVRRWTILITEAVLSVKQHSVNCIPAAMYAMTRFDPSLFPPEEGKNFAEELFRGSSIVRGEDAVVKGVDAVVEGADAVTEKDAEYIREHILSLYLRFLDEGEKAASWKDPLLGFLDKLPKAKL